MISIMLPKSWKKSFTIGVVIPVKMRHCNNCNGEILYDECKIQLNKNKEFEANSCLLKRQPPNQFSHMLSYYKLEVI